MSDTEREMLLPVQPMASVMSQPSGLWLILFCTRLPTALEIRRASQEKKTVSAAAVMETLLFLGAGLWMSKNLRYE